MADVDAESLKERLSKAKENLGAVKKEMKKENTAEAIEHLRIAIDRIGFVVDEFLTALHNKKIIR